MAVPTVLCSTAAVSWRHYVRALTTRGECPAGRPAAGELTKPVAFPTTPPARDMSERKDMGLRLQATTCLARSLGPHTKSLETGSPRATKLFTLPVPGKPTKPGFPPPPRRLSVSSSCSPSLRLPGCPSWVPEWPRLAP